MPSSTVGHKNPPDLFEPHASIPSILYESIICWMNRTDANVMRTVSKDFREAVDICFPRLGHLLSGLPSPVAVFFSCCGSEYTSSIQSMADWFASGAHVDLEDTYALPQLLPAHPEDNKALAHPDNSDIATSILLRGYEFERIVMRNLSRAGPLWPLQFRRKPQIMPLMSLCLFGGSEKVFYMTYKKITENCCAVWLLVEPTLSCRINGGPLFEEEGHIRSLINYMRQDQPLVVSLINVSEEKISEVAQILHLDQIVAERKWKGECMAAFMRCNLESGEGLADGARWLSERSSPNPEHVQLQKKDRCCVS